MDKITHEVRIANWRNIIEQCQARPEGQSARQWLADNGISEKNYYYWQRKVRQEAYALIKQDAVSSAMPAPDTRSVTFAEIPYAAVTDNLQPFTPDVVIRKGQTVLELSNSVSDKILEKIMEVMSND